MFWLSPNCPTSPVPHVHNVPSALIAAVETFILAVLKWSVFHVPGICFGDDISVLLGWLCPNLPFEPLPHDHNDPSVLVAKTALPPTVTPAQLVSVPICFGDVAGVPSFCPNPPEALFPHDQSVPSVLVAIFVEPPPPPLIVAHVVPGIWDGEERL